MKAMSPGRGRPCSARSRGVTASGGARRTVRAARLSVRRSGATHVRRCSTRIAPPGMSARMLALARTQASNPTALSHAAPAAGWGERLRRRHAAHGRPQGTGAAGYANESSASCAPLRLRRSATPPERRAADRRGRMAHASAPESGATARCLLQRRTRYDSGATAAISTPPRGEEPRICPPDGRDRFGL